MEQLAPPVPAACSAQAGAVHSLEEKLRTSTRLTPNTGQSVLDVDAKNVYDFEQGSLPLVLSELDLLAESPCPDVYACFQRLLHKYDIAKAFRVRRELVNFKKARI